ncbi:endoglucanase E-4-like [Babylonia areolata]|uniref:endoglucanase E-4-like n=1 Tax=Babylonia areolata TaxID=304850 RepID=UPI003FCFCA77
MEDTDAARDTRRDGGDNVDGTVVVELGGQGTMSRSVVVLTALAAVALVSEGKNVTADLNLMQHWDDNWEGKFCFDLPTGIVGYEIIMHFDTPVKNIQQWEADWVQQPSGCSTDLTLVNKESHGLHPAGQYCVRMMGKVCQGPPPTGHATLVDLTEDGMQVPTVPAPAGAAPMKYNYAEVLEKSLLFYEAQRSGPLPDSNRIPWRGDSGLQDRGQGGEDLTGGWYDAGDNVKFNFPMAWSTTVLCWSLLEFRDAYSQAGQLRYMYDGIRWPLEYFLKCHTKPNELYVQVGSGGRDHGSWTSPEQMDPNRPAFKIDSAHPGSDVAMETAAAMACGSMAFNAEDPDFSAKLLTEAKAIYTFAKNHQGIYSNSVNDAAAYYRSSNMTDENTWGAAWLYKATQDPQYLQEARQSYSHEPAWGFSWDEKIAGNQILLYNLTQDQSYKADIESSMAAWSKAGGMTYTPKCLAFRLQWGALRYSANTAFIALMAAQSGVRPAENRQWALCQIHYALGDTGRSFVVGFGTNPPTQPHHRGSSCPMKPAPCGWEAQQNPGPNPHVLYGALVGGPGSSDQYQDDRKDYIHNEVACDYNAGFQAAVAEKDSTVQGV